MILYLPLVWTMGVAMAIAVAITNLEFTAADLRRLMSKERDGEIVRRLSALALVLEGHSRTHAAEQSGMDRQTLCDWVHRYNAGGVAALASGKSTGRAPKLNAAQMAELYELVIKGPDPEIDGVVRWRCVDLRAQIARRFSVDVPERTVAKWLRRLRLTRLQPRPFHPKQDVAAQEEFKKNLAAWP
jgi:transposase